MEPSIVIVLTLYCVPHVLMNNEAWGGIDTRLLLNTC